MQRLRARILTPPIVAGDEDQTRIAASSLS
jgi:hypothetical protein